MNKEHVLKYKLERIEDQVHVYWQQHAHNSWLLKGDRNMKFFHAFASKRKRMNMVKKLEDDGGGVVDGGRLKSYIVGQYQNLFLSCAGGGVEEVTDCVQHRVTHEMNEQLNAPYSGDEVWEALQCIGDLKAPRADGIPAIFYKRFWHLLGEHIKKEVCTVLNGGEMLAGCGTTLLWF